MFKKYKRGQISFEFSIIVLSILLISSITLSYFLTSSFDTGTRTLDKIDIGAKTAVSLVNSGYNGTNVDGTITYAGMTWNESDDGHYNVTIYVINTTSLNGASEFIINYTIESQNIDTDKFTINLNSN